MRALWLATVSGLLIGGCSVDDPFGSAGIDTSQCTSTVPLAEVTGEWTVTGSGSRRDCSDEGMNTDAFALHAVLPMAATTDHAKPGEAALVVVGNPAPAGVAFSVVQSQVIGSCVSVQFREDDLRQTPTATIETTFTANVAGTTMKGRFTQNGPRSCFAEGTFLATIR